MVIMEALPKVFLSLIIAEPLAYKVCLLVLKLKKSFIQSLTFQESVFSCLASHVFCKKLIKSY
jgi:hypothetical protein